MISRPPNRLRLFATSFAIILAIQSAWFLGPELVRPALPFFPANEAQVKIAASQTNAAASAVWLGWPRGDLWTDYAMTVDTGFLGDTENGTNSGAQSANNELHSIAGHAATLAPYDSRAWLLVAASDIQSRPHDNQALAQIKMSYYTSPNDARLMPFRIQLATRSSLIADDELQSFVGNELRTIILHSPDLKPSIALAYRSASPVGRRFLESKLADLDNGFLHQLQSEKP
jgi:hypothetical protein